MSQKRPYYIPEGKWIEDIPSYVLNVANQYLPLRDFEFHETYRDEEILILSSDECKISFHVSWEAHPYNHYDGEYALSIYYGRLHAHDRLLMMKWAGEICECWLDLSWHRVLEYVDYAFQQRQRPELSQLVGRWREVQDTFPDHIHWYISLTAEIWKWYAPELFHLFDLRRPELWEQYRAWLKARYIAEGRKEEEDERKGIIPYYRVC
ncbi:MAG: hypothetical protein ACOYYI_06575 [Chloroflexota bacterium]